MKIIYLIIILIILIFLIDGTPYLHLEFKRVMSFITPHKNNFVSLPMKKLKIAIITAENRNEEYIKLHDQSLTEYCKKYNYDYIRMVNSLKQDE